jgi:hypothetical protein
MDTTYTYIVVVWQKVCFMFFNVYLELTIARYRVSYCTITLLLQRGVDLTHLSPNWIEEEDKNGDESGHDRGGTQPAMSLSRCWCGARCRCWCSVAARRHRVVANRRRRVVATRRCRVVATRRCRVTATRRRRVVATRWRRIVTTRRDSVVVFRWAVIG